MIEMMRMMMNDETDDDDVEMSTYNALMEANDFTF